MIVTMETVATIAFVLLGVLVLVGCVVSAVREGDEVLEIFLPAIVFLFLLGLAAAIASSVQEDAANPCIERQSTTEH
jgi:hypothetical protein